MTEPLFSSDLSFDEEDKYLKANLSLQKAMLLLVEQCHQPDYQATLDCSLKALEDLSRRKKSDPQVVILMAASMKKVLTMVLSACFDVSKEKTIAKMQSGFEVMNADLSSEHEQANSKKKLSVLMTSSYLEQRAARGDRGRFEQALAKVSAVPPDEQDQL